MDKKVKVARTQLSELQGQIRNHRQHQALFQEEKQLKEQVEKWSNIQESIAR